MDATVVLLAAITAPHSALAMGGRGGGSARRGINDEAEVLVRVRRNRSRDDRQARLRGCAGANTRHLPFLIQSY